jgi:hypothetical protein
MWDASVHEALAILEGDERAAVAFASPARSPTQSPLRLALSASLHTTATQCERVRLLLSALTDPAELALLAEMYAPPSPSLAPASGVALRLGAVPRTRTTSLPQSSMTMAEKRATWNGSYTALARTGRRPVSVMSKQEKRRSDMSTLLGSPLARNDSVRSAPTTPARDPALQGVEEQEEAREERPAEEEREVDDDTHSPILRERDYFGTAALDLRRRRRAGGLDTLGLASPTSTGSWTRDRDSFASSRFTTLHARAAHPLSLHALHQAVQNALASKRYACAHLLALRFDEADAESEDEDGHSHSYWEDVQSVMALLTSTFVDAGERLAEALDEAERRRLKEATPSPALAPYARRPTTPSESQPHSRVTSLDLDAPVQLVKMQQKARAKMRTVQEMLGGADAGSGSGFAPMPSHMARFAQHVDAMSSALDEARGHLERCVAALRVSSAANSDDEDGQGDERASSSSSSSAGAGHTPLPPQEAPALKAYDRLRRELGFALRECERGRERLLDVLAAQNAVANEDEEPDAEYADDVPLLAPDTGSGSDESDKHLSGDYQFGAGYRESIGSLLGMVPEDAAVVAEHDQSLDIGTDDAQVLVGAEQVFESDAIPVGSFTRERSKLSREERIKIAKARREKGLSVLQSASSAGAEGEPEEEKTRALESEKWGPGGDVVQELKDVIWQVGERRRKLTTQPLPETQVRRPTTSDRSSPAPPDTPVLSTTL